MHFIQLFTNIIFCLFNHFCVFVFGGEKLFLLSFFLFGCFVGILLGVGLRFGANWGLMFLFMGYWVSDCWGLLKVGGWVLGFGCKWVVGFCCDWLKMGECGGWMRDWGREKRKVFFEKVVKNWVILRGGGWMKEIFAKWKNAKKLSKNCEKSENFVYFLWFLCIFWFSAKVFFHLYLSHKERFWDGAFFLTYFVDLVYNISIENIY